MTDMETVLIGYPDGGEEPVPVQAVNGRVKLRNIRNYIDQHATGLKALVGGKWVGVAMNDDGFKVDQSTQYRVFFPRNVTAGPRSNCKAVEDESTRKARELRGQLDENRKAVIIQPMSTGDKNSNLTRMKAPQKNIPFEVMWYHRQHGGADYVEMKIDDVILTAYEADNYSVTGFIKMAVKGIRARASSTQNKLLDKSAIELATRGMAVIKGFWTTNMRQAFYDYVNEKGAGGHRVGFKILSTTSLVASTRNDDHPSESVAKIHEKIELSMTPVRARQVNWSNRCEDKENLTAKRNEIGRPYQPHIPHNSPRTKESQKTPRNNPNEKNIFGNNRFQFDSNNTEPKNALAERVADATETHDDLEINENEIWSFDYKAILPLPGEVAHKSWGPGFQALLEGEIKRIPPIEITSIRNPSKIIEDRLKSPGKQANEEIIVVCSNTDEIMAKRMTPPRVPSTRLDLEVMKIISVESPLLHAIPIEDLASKDTIGEGAYGFVQKALYKVGSYFVAVKKINPDLKNATEMTINEAKLLSKLIHPSIVKVVGLTEDYEKNLRIVLEYVPGFSLAQILFEPDVKQSMKLSSEEEMKTSRELIQAVAYLHDPSNEILHNDLKPANVIFNPTTRDSKLCDFGLCQESVVDENMDETNDDIERRGTLYYMAPEVLLRSKRNSKASDVWSLCCTVVGIFAKIPIWGMQDPEQLESYLAMNFLMGIVPGTFGVPSKFRAAVQDGLRPAPGQRVTAQELLAKFTE